MSNFLPLLLFFGLLIVTFIVSYLYLRPTKWSCTENKCEQDMDGNFLSLGECQKSCEQERKNEERQLNRLNQENQAWACTNNYNCVKASQGYTSKELCEQNCSRPTDYTTYVGYPTYYPQSLIYRRPYYWGYGGYRGPRGPRGHRGHRRHGLGFGRRGRI